MPVILAYMLHTVTMDAVILTFFFYHILSGKGPQLPQQKPGIQVTLHQPLDVPSGSEHYFPQGAGALFHVAALVIQPNNVLWFICHRSVSSVGAFRKVHTFEMFI